MRGNLDGKTYCLTYQFGRGLEEVHEQPRRSIEFSQQLGRFQALEATIADHRAHDGVMAARYYFVVNISLPQLKDRSFGLKVLRILGESGLPAVWKSNWLSRRWSRILRTRRRCSDRSRDSGVRIALGDFGTGYSSLYDLRIFRIDKIKIDRSFIGNVAENPNFIRTLLGLGHGLGSR